MGNEGQPSIRRVTPDGPPRDVAGHMLGPHVVGQRIVVRRVVRGERGPSGGPALTDLLGVCTAWGDGVCVVQPERGPAVEIPLADIVSGKPVPARPSVRHRVPVRDAELHTARLFPGVETQELGVPGGWVLRWEPMPVGRLRKRANSCLAIGDPGAPLEEALSAVVGFYADRGRRPLVQVEADSDVEAGVRAAGWSEVAGGEAEHRLASLARVRRALGPVAEPPGLGLEVDGPRATARVRVGGEEVAVGHGGLDGDWLGLHGLDVRPQWRRRGLARQLVAALLEWGAEQGATTAWLHVETDNEPALALWDALGFAAHHTCRYLTPEPPEPPERP